MMKILIIQENGRHTENRFFRECFTIQDGLKKMVSNQLFGG